MESVAELFTLVWNEYLKDGVINDEERATLESIKAIYSDLVDKQKEYADGLERENKIKSSIESMQSNAKNYQTQYEQLGMDADAKAMDDLNRAFDELLSSVGLSGAELDALAQQYEENADKMSEADRKRYEDAVAEINKLNNAHSDEIKWLKLLQKAQAENERKEKARNAILEAQNKVIDLQTQISQLYMTDEEKALDDLRIAYEKLTDGMNLTDEESSKMLATYNEQVRTLTTLQSLTKAYNDQLEREENIKGHKESAQDYRTQLNNLGKTEAEITRNNLLEQLYKAQWNGDYDEELVASIKEEIEAFDALQEATAKLEKVETSFADNITNGIFGKYANTGFAQGVGSAIASSTGGQIIQAGIEGGSVGGGWGAIIGVLTAILSKTESFEQILSMVEPVIQMFDNLIKPLVPAIQIISDTLNTLVMAMIRPLLPVFKIIAETIVLISTPIKMIHAVIDNIYIAVHNIVDKLTNWGRNQWGYNSIKDIMNETVESLETIHNLTFDIKENTKKDDARYRAYREMFDKQMITESEYEALIAGIEGIHYDRAKTYNGMAWSNGSGGTTIIYNGDMRFIIEGTNLSADQIAEATIRKQKQLATTGHFF